MVGLSLNAGGNGSAGYFTNSKPISSWLLHAGLGPQNPRLAEGSAILGHFVACLPYRLSWGLPHFWLWPGLQAYISEQGRQSLCLVCVQREKKGPANIQKNSRQCHEPNRPSNALQREWGGSCWALLSRARGFRNPHGEFLTRFINVSS
jgi:hypothetical protein